MLKGLGKITPSFPQWVSAQFYSIRCIVICCKILYSFCIKVYFNGTRQHTIDTFVVRVSCTRGTMYILIRSSCVCPLKLKMFSIYAFRKLLVI